MAIFSNQEIVTSPPPTMHGFAPSYDDSFSSVQVCDATKMHKVL
ncbi:MAG TPA: hypothetical protein VH396_00325 [Chitinophagaceae bacterium]